MMRLKPVYFVLEWTGSGIRNLTSQLLFADEFDQDEIEFIKREC